MIHSRYRCWGVPAVFSACSDETRLHWFHASSMDLDTEFELIGILIGELQTWRPPVEPPMPPAMLLLDRAACLASLMYPVSTVLLPQHGQHSHP